MGRQQGDAVGDRLAGLAVPAVTQQRTDLVELYNEVFSVAGWQVVATRRGW
ncbi:hypothetical protein Ae406Ps2_3434 [Pseudonocardia sp. Ae406_Ps2]|nr:hypothetical protein Ae406Ps2_3434 [Pseudonocardia sp. Ae406_Ps2]OLM24993.1 hypothetical protein Ae706Ps2_3426 [Pseudonocardia sp. Ae706_Ps2]OLM24997.1 hypothetical protein Ae706Ps2_3430 [Pseudonocardia sp. Ae706_Ps2]